MSGFTRNDVIKGINFFHGDIDGSTIDVGKIFIEEPLSEARGTSKGFRTVEYKTADSGAVRAISHLEFPLTAEVQYELKASSKGAAMVTVLSIKPMGKAQPQPRAS